MWAWFVVNSKKGCSKQRKVTGTSGNTVLSQGDALADFLLGDIASTTIAVAVANANYVRNVEAFYLDDTYKITPKLTISAGLRYELTPPWVDTLGNNFTVKIPVMPVMGNGTFPQSQWPYFVRQGHCSNAYQGLAINWTDSAGHAGTTANSAPVCSNGTLPDALMNTPYLNFAPRLGISYSPNSTLVIRTGFGIF
jgi:outer membrane receptor protein involved in Fe transport